MKLVSPLDAAWLYVESRETPMHVGCLQIFSPPPHAPANYAGRALRELRDTRSFAPPFSIKLQPSRLRAVLPFWVEDQQLDMSYHLRHTVLPAPGGERELGQLIARLQRLELDLSRPLWDCHFIEGLQGGRFALFFKMHHALMDGIGGVRLLQAVLSGDPQRRDLPPPWAPHPGTGQPRSLESPHGDDHDLGRLLHRTLTQLRALPGVYGAFAELAQAAVGRAQTPLSVPYMAPRSIFNGRLSSQRRFATLQLSLERIHGLAHRAGATVNDVFLDLCASALRRYLIELNALPQQPLIAGIPVSVRPDGDMSPGTAISFILSTLATDIEDPRRRLQVIHEATRAAKSHLHRMEHEAFTPYTLLLMAPYIMMLMGGLGGRGRPVFNLAVSDVPGPDHPLYFNGARMEAMYPMSILTHGQGLNITVLSYNGWLNVGYTACRKSAPHVQRLAVYTREALDELEALIPKAAAAPGKAKATRRRRPPSA